MFADVAVLPSATGVNDWYLLGWPTSLIVFLTVTASLTTMFVVLSRRWVRKRWALVICLGLFIVADLVVYATIYETNHEWYLTIPRQPRPLRELREQRPNDKDQIPSSPRPPE